jgi:hypothetical protein
MKRSRDPRAHQLTSNQPFKPTSGMAHPMDELGAIEEEEVAGLNANGTDSILLTSESKPRDHSAHSNRSNKLD